jgi:hypothetical protein
MLIKESKQSALPVALAENLWRPGGRLRWAIVTPLILLTGILVFTSGVYMQRTGYLSDVLKPMVMRNVVNLHKKIGATFQTPDVESIIVDIKHKDFMKLAYKRQLAINAGVLFSTGDDFVKAQIRHKDQVMEASVRLKGDEPDHFAGDKWSYRIRIKGDNTLFGMKEFSIQHPQTRSFIYEWLLHQALAAEELIHLRYKFIDVTINGTGMGIYALEEHMEKRLIEHNQRREGPILKFGEELLWHEVMQQVNVYRQASWNGSGSYTSAEIEAFKMSSWEADSANAAILRNACNILDSFRRGELTTSEAFDVDKLAKYFAVMDLFGAFNGTQWCNMRFYFNPITSKLEPIGRDGTAEPLTRISGSLAKSATQADVYDGLIYEQFFSDISFYARYIEELERVSNLDYLDTFFSNVGEELASNLATIHTEYSDFEFSKEVIYGNQEYIRSVLNPVKGFHAYMNSADANRITLDMGSIQTLPVEILSVSYRDSILLDPSPAKVVLHPHDVVKPVQYDEIQFGLPRDLVWADSMMADLKVNFRYVGSTKLRQEAVFPRNRRNDYVAESDFLRSKPNVADFKFLVTDEPRKEILIKPGNWTIDKSLIIPSGYTVICGEGTTMNLTNSAVILSYSTLKWIGGEDYPVTLHSVDSTGQGLIVMNAEEPCVFEHVVFSNLSSPSQGGWVLTGAVTLYESDTQISYCQFLSNRSEDGLNIVRSQFTIANSLFSDTFSDAFDGDFTTGNIRNTSFVNCGNDGIDVSGSVIDIRDVLVNGAGDKGLSSGENSQMNVDGIEIKDAEIGVASKDISHIKIKNARIEGGQIAFSAYQKKPEFGPASIRVITSSIENTQIPYLVEERSEVTVDAVPIPPSRDNVKDILYGVEFGKASR